MPLSAKQLEYLALTWQCFETEPKIDYTKFAKLANLASPASARELLRVTKKKLREEASQSNPEINGGSTPKSTPKATPKKRKAAAKEDGDEDDDEESVSPKKKGRKVGRGKKGGDGEESPVKTEEGEEETEDFLL